MKLVKVLPILVVALLLAVPGFAQTGNLAGKVVDTDGKPLTGVTISIDRQGINQHFEVKTDKNGQYLHAGLPTGNYKVSVVRDGKPLMTLDGRVQFGQDSKVDFDLKAAAQPRAARGKRRSPQEDRRGKGQERGHQGFIRGRPRRAGCEELRRSDPPLQGSFRKRSDAARDLRESGRCLLSGEEVR